MAKGGIPPGVLGLIVILSVCSNLLMLTGPIFMLQVYDRVLTSGSAQTLLVLLGLVGLLYGLYAVFEFCRSRLLARHGAALALADVTLIPDSATTAARHRLARLLGSPAAVALLDLPWSPIFFLAMFAFHPWIGATALGGAAVLLAIGAAHHMATRTAREGSVLAAEEATAADRTLRQAQACMPGGFGPQTLLRARENKVAGLILAELRLGDLAAGFVAGARGFRLFLQSFVLAVGAWLVLDGQLSGGEMIAGSILLGRALAPLEATLANWTALIRAGDDIAFLRKQHEDRPQPRTRLPAPEGPLLVQGLTIIPPGQRRAVIRGATLQAPPGSVTGICGANGSGKSLLLAALAGRIEGHGQIMLGGHPVAHYGADLARHVGWLPQDSGVFPDTIARNISCRLRDASAEQLHAAARDAGALSTINALPLGMDTRLWPGGPELNLIGISAGAARRVALARAICGGPSLLLLDEPDALLDTAGLAMLLGLLNAERERGTIVVLATHNAAILRACDQRLLLEGGRLAPVRPVEDTTRNPTTVFRPAGWGAQA